MVSSTTPPVRALHVKHSLIILPPPLACFRFLDFAFGLVLVAFLSWTSFLRYHLFFFFTGFLFTPCPPGPPPFFGRPRCFFFSSHSFETRGWFAVWNDRISLYFSDSCVLSIFFFVKVFPGGFTPLSLSPPLGLSLLLRG